MTIVAWRAPFLAADTATTYGDSLIRRDVPKIVSYEGYLAAAAGSAVYHGAFIRWFMSGMGPYTPPQKTDGEDADIGIVVMPDGTLKIYENWSWYPAAPAYFAIGSGAPFALGAMFHGASAGDAVKAAIEHDPFSGGDITVLELGVK